MKIKIIFLCALTLLITVYTQLSSATNWVFIVGNYGEFGDYKPGPNCTTLTMLPPGQSGPVTVASGNEDVESSNGDVVGAGWIVNDGGLLDVKLGGCDVTTTPISGMQGPDYTGQNCPVTFQIGHTYWFGKNLGQVHCKDHTF